MRYTFRSAKLVLFALIVSVGLRQISAQAINGELVGAINDVSRAGVPQANIEAVNELTGVKTEARANGQGQYLFPNLPSGTYRITAGAEGFKSTTLNGVVVDANKVSTVNLTLAIGSLSQSVEVTTAAATIDTTTATIGSTFDTVASTDLPVASIGLGSANLTLLNAGVTSNGGLSVGEGPSVGGQRPYNNNFMIEGIDDNNKAVTGSLVRFIPNDAVAEFTVLQNQMSAEFGHSSGGQFNTVIRSGTNQLHGTLYDYFQNRNLNAIDQQVQNSALAAGERPKNTRFDANRFGASLGGPIRKNKLFYFGDYEFYPIGAAATLASSVFSPTAAGYSLLNGLSGLSRTNLSQFEKYVPAAPNPLGTISVLGQDIPVGQPAISAPNYQNNYAAVASADDNISDRDQLRGRFLYNKLSQIDTSASIPAFYQLSNNTYYVTTLSEYHTFTPSLFNEFRLGYTRLNQDLPAGNFQFPGLDKFPTFTFDELGLDLGPSGNAPQSEVQNTYQLVNNVTWTKGNHTLKFGVDGRKYIAPSSFTQRPRGSYEYSTLELYLLDLTPDQEAQRGLGNVVFYGDQIAFYSFINDSWRIRPNLTLNLGLRHEYTTVPFSERLQALNHVADVPGVLVFNEPEPQTRNFAPRIGLAYSPGSSGRTSIRAGFGMAYDVLYDNIGQLALPPQLGSTVDITNRGDPLTGAPNFLANGGIAPNLVLNPTVADLRSETANYIPDQKLPYSIQWNFGIQHVFARDYTFEARYLGTRGVHLDLQERLNERAIVTPDHNLPTFMHMPSQAHLDSLPLTLDQLENEDFLVPKFENAGFTNSALVVDSPIGNSSYHGLALQLNRRFSRGLQFVGSYTWSHLIDDSTADFNTTALTPRRPQDFEYLRPERASSALDHRHRLTLSAVWDVPWYKHSNWALRNLIGNWEVAPIYTFESPEYVTVQSQQDSNLNGDPFTDRVLVNPGGLDNIGSDVIPLCRGAAACDPSADGIDARIVGYLAVNPNARYITAGRGAYANGGRNTLAGRPINNWDVNLLKSFNLNERVRVQFSAQLFNAFNHPQFVPGFVNRVDNPAVLNNNSAVWNYTSPNDPTFNNPEAIFSSNPRGIQLALKLFF